MTVYQVFKENADNLEIIKKNQWLQNPINHTVCGSCHSDMSIQARELLRIKKKKNIKKDRKWSRMEIVTKEKY